MFDLSEWVYGYVEENDPDDFAMPYRIYGPTDQEVMLGRYMQLDNLEKPNIVYPAIANLLS